jgi:hypothetical protein
MKKRRAAACISNNENIFIINMDAGASIKFALVSIPSENSGNKEL